MSVRESLHIFHRVEVEKYLDVLKGEFGARENEQEPGSYLIGDPPLPFYKPQVVDGGYLAIVGFNYTPLSAMLLVALINHPELAPETTAVAWTIEQDVLAQGTLFELKQALAPEEE